MHTLTNAREREGRASARAEWPGRPAGPWPAPELELQGAGKRPGPGKATRSRSPPDGMATSPQHPPHGARARGRGGGGSRSTRHTAPRPGAAGEEGPATPDAALVVPSPPPEA